MKKISISLIICLVALSIGIQAVRASEVTGTLSTDGSSSTNNSTGGTGGTTTGDTGGSNSTSTQTTTAGHSSEVTGTLALGGTVQGGYDATTSQTNNSNATDTSYHSPTEGLAADYSYVASQYSMPGGYYNPLNATSTAATSTDGLTDEERAHLALIDFGPRYALPGAPNAGGPGLNQLTVGASDIGHNLDSISSNVDSSGVAFLPSSGEGQANQSDLSANVLTDATGLSMPQLILIGLLGLILLGSMGYAISRTNQQRPV